MIELINKIVGKELTRKEIATLVKRSNISGYFTFSNNLRKLLFDNPETEKFIITDVSDSNLIDQISLYGIEEDNSDFESLDGTNEIYQEITNLVIKTIEKNSGKLIWEKPWKDAHKFGRVMNYVSKKPYRGVNAMLLEVIYPIFYGKNWTNPFFLTAAQVKEKKGTVKDGAKAYPVVFYTIGYRYQDKKENIDITTYSKKDFINKIKAVKHKIYEFKSNVKLSLDVFADIHRFSFLRKYKVYNGEDIEGIEFKIEEFKIKNKFTPIETAEIILDHMPKKPRITTGGDSAFYSPSKDFVNMPAREAFKGEAKYYATLFHELIHSTGHPSRVGRSMKGSFGSLEYAYEELIAELGASFITAESGILNHHIKNTAAYLEGWNKRLLSRLKDDKTFIFRASGAAQKAADFILDVNKAGIPKYRQNLVVEPVKSKKKKSTEKTREKKNKPSVKESKKNTAPSLKPNKKVSASVITAIKDLLTLDKYKRYSEMAMQMLYSAFKNSNSVQVETKGLRAKMFQNQLEDKYAWVEYEYKDDLYYITDAGKQILDAIDGRLKTLKAKKGGQDLFPELAGTASNKTVVAFNKAILLAKRKGFSDDKVFDLGYTEKKLREIIGKSRITISGSVIKKSMTKDSDHILEWHHLINLPDSINDPIAIFKSDSVDNGFVILTELKDKKNKPLMGAIHINDQLHISKIASLYSKRSIKSYQNWDKKGLTLYKDKRFRQLLPAPIAISHTSKPFHKDKNKSLSGQDDSEKTVNKISNEFKVKAKHSIFQRPGEEVKKIDVFRLPGEIGKFLQDLQKYRMAILLKGDPHAGKTQFAWQLIDAFIEGGFTTAVFDLEQGGLSSKDTQDSVDKNVDPERKNFLNVAGEAPKGIDTIREWANEFDVIMIDSWQKLKVPNTRLDDLRNEFPNTIFILIFQQNSEGGTRGGVSADYDTPIAIKVHKVDKTFVNNYAELQKNRGNRIGLKYNVASGKIMPEDEPSKEEENV